MRRESSSRAEHGAAVKADALALHPGNIVLSGVLQRNAAQSIEDLKKERWRKKHAGELLRQQRGRP